MDFSSFRPVEAAVTLSVIWIGLGGAGLVLARVPRAVTDWVFPAGAAVALALVPVFTRQLRVGRRPS